MAVCCCPGNGVLELFIRGISSFRKWIVSHEFLGASDSRWL